MTDCRSTLRELPAYVDEVMAPEPRAAVARHLNLCPRCRREEVAQRSASTILRHRASSLKDLPPPPGLRARCQAAMLAGQPTAGRSWIGVLVPTALAAVLIVVTAGALFRVATERSTTVLAAELTADHVKCFRLFASGTMKSADPVALESMFRARYGWDVRVPPSSDADGLRLDGARKCTYAEGPIPHVMYQAHGQNVSLFILEGVSRASADVTTFGHRARIWSRGRTTYVLVSSAAAGTLSDVVGYVQREAQ
jgi:anti-sigma factor RsiW